MNTTFNLTKLLWFVAFCAWVRKINKVFVLFSTKPPKITEPELSLSSYHEASPSHLLCGVSIFKMHPDMVRHYYKEGRLIQKHSSQSLFSLKKSWTKSCLCKCHIASGSCCYLSATLHDVTSKSFRVKAPAFQLCFDRVIGNSLFYGALPFFW